MANEEKKTEKNKPKPCPKWLSAAAKKEWRRIAKIFAEEEKEFTDKDLKALEAYCTARYTVAYHRHAVRQFRQLSAAGRNIQ